MDRKDENERQARGDAPKNADPRPPPQRNDEQKKQALLAALERGMVMIHLDARRPGVLVPSGVGAEPHLRLNLSYRFDPPDLSVNAWGIRATLSFNRTPFKVAIPWSALFAITSHVTRESWFYPDDMPGEVIRQVYAHLRADSCAERRKAAEEKRPTVLREVSGPKPDGPDGGCSPKSRGHLRIIK